MEDLKLQKFIVSLPDSKACCVAASDETLAFQEYCKVMGVPVDSIHQPTVKKTHADYPVGVVRGEYFPQAGAGFAR